MIEGAKGDWRNLREAYANNQGLPCMRSFSKEAAKDPAKEGIMQSKRSHQEGNNAKQKVPPRRERTDARPL